MVKRPDIKKPTYEKIIKMTVLHYETHIKYLNYRFWIASGIASIAITAAIGFLINYFFFPTP